LTQTTRFQEVNEVREKRQLFLSTVNDEMFWIQLKHAERVLNPLSKTIAAFESDACCLADIYQLFLDLRKGFTVEPHLLELVWIDGRSCIQKLWGLRIF
jgi:hypothetical protein